MPSGYPLPPEQRATNKSDYKRDWMRIYRRKNPELCMLISARQRAKKRGLSITITEADIIIPAFCPVLGIPIRPNAGRHDAHSPTLDRIYSDHGYTKWNVRVISYRANNLKSDMTLAECRLIMKDLEDRI